MSDKLLQFGSKVISGEDRSVMAGIIRAAAAVVEPFYSSAMRVRNWAYGQGIFPSHDLGRPTISVGNLTTGGTGKTPVVCWLAEALRASGRRPAILLRGYAAVNGVSDEAMLLHRAVNRSGELAVPVEANPSRVAGAEAVLKHHPGTDVFLLDDGFQHRRARRQFNLVLISATCPFGFGHVLPRGLLREPVSGLKRADAVLITRQSLASLERLQEIEGIVHRHNPVVPIFRADHVATSVRYPAADRRVGLPELATTPVMLLTGIGDPAAFERQVAAAGCRVVDRQFFPDHHAFTARELHAVGERANAAGAELMLTTEKDWVKLAAIDARPDRPPIGVVDLELKFLTGAGEFLDQIRSAVENAFGPF